MPTKVMIDEDIRISLPDHQILLSFINDDDVEVFLDWWYAEGYFLFQKYTEEEL